MLLQHRPSVRAQHPLCPELGFPFASATFQLHGLPLLPPRNSLWCISGLLRIEMPEGLRSAALWPVAEGRRAQFWDLCALGRLAAAACTAPRVYFAWLRLGALQMEALPSALGKRAGMRPAVWLAPVPFGVMRSSSKCMYANREPMLTALQELEWWAKHTDCFAAQLNVPWAYKTP